jgi:hypothetical protein
MRVRPNVLNPSTAQTFWIGSQVTGALQRVVGWKMGIKKATPEPGCRPCDESWENDQRLTTPVVTPGQLSVRKEVAGNGSLVVRFPMGLSAQL